MIKRKGIVFGYLPGILVCFFISGAAGLIYQVAWVKSLGLIFGHTVYAVTVVLAVFMAGLAVGSACFGSWVERRSDPLRFYAQIELLIAITGALSVAALAAVRWFYVLSFSSLHGWALVPSAIRLLGAALVLFVPTFLMGGTFPVLISAVAANGRALAPSVSRLYWVNTLGAVSGALISGFLLLPAIGLRLTIATAVGLNVLAGVIALLLNKQFPQTVSRRETGSTTPVREREFRNPAFLLVLFGIIGATAFAYEIAWTRLLSITIGSSTYAFTLMLATFLAGIALGSALFEVFFVDSKWHSRRMFAITQAAIGVCSVASLMLYGRVPELVAFLLRIGHGDFKRVLLAQFAASAVIMLPVAVLFGLNFPLVIALLAEHDGSGRRSSVVVGKGYAANTFGSIVGSLLAGFWLIPRVGSFRAIAATAAVNVLIAAALDLKIKPRRALFPALEGACLLLILFVGLSSAFYDRSLLAFSPLLYSESQHRLSVQEIAATSDIVFIADGVNSSVAVTRGDNNVTLRLNGKADASTHDSRTQLLLGHLGAAFHPAPHRVLVIGFGSAMTLSAVARYPDVDSIDCVELEPAVVQTAPYFKNLNHGVLRDPRVHIIYDDARNFLLTSRGQYDLIISEPSNPWIAGVASLFTDEFYRAAFDRLSSDGIFVQWVQAYSLAPSDLRMVLATFAGRFPQVSMWRGEELDFLLLGTKAKLAFDFNRLRAFWVSKGLHDDFNALDVHEPEGLIGYYLLNDSAVRQLGEHSVLNADDRTRLEYHAPQTMLQHDLGDRNIDLVASVRPSLPPPELGPADVQAALEQGVTTALDIGDIANAASFLNAPAFPRDSAAYSLAAGRLALAQSDLQKAEVSLQKAVKLDPDSPAPKHWLAITEHRLAHDADAQGIIDAVLAQDPQFLPALRDKTQFAVDRGDFQTALHAELEKFLLIEDPPASEYCRLGVILMKLSHVVAADAALQKGLHKDPYSYACHVASGELALETGKYPEARQNLEWLVHFFPDAEPSTFRSLAGLDLMMGDLKSAKAVVRKGQRIFPEDAGLKIQSLGQ